MNEVVKQDMAEAELKVAAYSTRKGKGVGLTGTRTAAPDVFIIDDAEGTPTRPKKTSIGLFLKNFENVRRQRGADPVYRGLDTETGASFWQDENGLFLLVRRWRMGPNGKPFGTDVEARMVECLRPRPMAVWAAIFFHTAPPSPLCTFKDPQGFTLARHLNFDFGV